MPKILIDELPARTSVRDTQLAEQLVEVPTIVTYSFLQRIREQNVDIPVPGGGGRHAGLQGFRPGQSSSSSSHVPARVHEALDEPGEGVFRQEKRPKSAASPSPTLCASASTPTPAAQLEDALVPDSIERVQLSDGVTGKTLLLEQTHSSDCLEVTAWRQFRLGRRED